MYVIVIVTVVQINRIVSYRIVTVINRSDRSEHNK